jgi:hypothetical protein
MLVEAPAQAQRLRRSAQVVLSDLACFVVSTLISTA